MDFRSSAKVVKLNVNDNGYCIELHTSSDAWLKRFLDFATSIEKKNNAHAEALKGVDDIDAQINHLIEFDYEIKEAFEELFGADSYEQTFGSELVGVEYIVEFIDACMPFIQKRVEEREKAFSKYNPGKTGGVR